MQVKAITVNAAEMMTERQSIPGNGIQAQAESNYMFAPECKVTISREGRNLSRQQMAQAESNVQSTKSVAVESNPLSKQEETKGLRENLMEMFREIGLSGQNLLDRVDEVYSKMCRPSHGDLQFSLNESSEEAMAAVKELAQKAGKVEDITVDPSRAKDLIQAAQEYSLVMPGRTE
ncbi:MAG: hypothetical protein NC123_12805 [Butyrivibrio sp.]|nr:hypothetical protein [Acetatifactor muris]MCM1560400.1 hypothetical protein [Butyrivibrio sp.]